MLTLTDLLSGPAAAPEGLHARLPGTVAAVPSAGFAATLASARTAAEAVPGLPVSPIPRAFPGAPPGGEGLEETGEAATAAAFPVPPGFGEPLPVPREPLGAAISTISREGTGHGRPGGNGLPLPGSDGGKTLPDVPPVRPSAAPSAAIGALVQRSATGTAGGGGTDTGWGSVPGHGGRDVSGGVALGRAACRGVAGSVSADSGCSDPHVHGRRDRRADGGYGRCRGRRRRCGLDRGASDRVGRRAGDAGPGESAGRGGGFAWGHPVPGRPVRAGRIRSPSRHAGGWVPGVVDRRGRCDEHRDGHGVAGGGHCR